MIYLILINKQEIAYFQIQTIIVVKESGEYQKNTPWGVGDAQQLVIRVSDSALMGEECLTGGERMRGREDLKWRGVG